MKLVRAAAIAALVTAALSGCAGSSGGYGTGSSSFSFDTGSVRLGYSDGYWDTNHNWHSWGNARESREFRARYKARYVHDRHTRYKNEGWRDSDGDGIPDRLDSRPNNSRRQ